MSDTAGERERTVPRADIDAEWAPLFPFDPYPQQVDGVESALDAVSRDGYLLLEGACGTGKTLIALVAGIQAIADGHAARVMAVTPVKQQLRQFRTEVRAINANLGDSGESPVDGLVMVGKSDLLPYARTDALGGDGSVHEASSDMRERTAALVTRDSNLALDVQPGDLDGQVTVCDDSGCDRLAYADAVCRSHRGGRDEDEPWYDPVRAAAVCHLVAEASGPRLETAGVEAPYPADPPHVRDVLAPDSGPLSADADGAFDPFYARFFADEEWVPFGFEEGDEGVLDPETLVRASVARGTCPHECMAALMGEADVLVGNYNHAFDPRTRRLTNEKAGVLDDETLLVVDEAHMVEERVRDLLSDTLSLHAIRTARRDVTLAREYLSGTGGGPGADPGKHQRDAREVIAEFDAVDDDALLEMKRFLDWLVVAIDDEVDAFLAEQYGETGQAGEYGGASGWERRLDAGTLPDDDHEIPLRDPEVVAVDRLTERAGEQFGPQVWRRMREAGYVAAEIHENDDQTDRTPVAAGVGEFCSKWGRVDHGSYFREIELEHAEKALADSTLPDWVSAYNASLTLYNCIPRGSLARIFDELAGGVLMSATLEPFSVYRRATGLDLLVDPDGEGGTDDRARPVETASYGLAFPERNRASWVVDLAPFTYRNRGDRADEYDDMTWTRRSYASALVTAARSPGNVLVCMPSYAEAEWAVDWLRAQLSKPVIRDRSTDASETDAMLERFFSDDGIHRVLVTSARGTVTEGVDYRGSRLHTACIVGVPYANTNAPRMKAVTNAYDEEFDGNGFEYAVKVPAVRKSRQAFGRVLRGHDEVGVRMLLDRRYDAGAPRSVATYLSDSERREFTRVSPDMLSVAVDRFWDDAET